MDSIEKKMEEKLGSVIKMVQTLSKSKNSQETGGKSACQIPVSQDDHSPGVLESVLELNGPSRMQALSFRLKTIFMIKCRHV